MDGLVHHSGLVLRFVNEFNNELFDLTFPNSVRKTKKTVKCFFIRYNKTEFIENVKISRKVRILNRCIYRFQFLLVL